MKSNEDFIIPGLRSIGWLRTKDLPPHIRFMSRAGMIPVITASVTDISFFGSAELSFSGGEGRKQESTLKFSSSDGFPQEDISFIVELRSHRRFVIGALEPPFPQIEISAETGAKPSDKSAVSYTVKWAGKPTRVSVFLSEDKALPLR